MKKFLLVVSPFIKYILFFYLALFSVDDWYFNIFNLYVSRVYVLMLYFSICIVITLHKSCNEVYKKFWWGQVSLELLPVEIFMFLLFTQYFTITAILLLLFAVGAAVGIHLYFTKGMDRRKKKLSHKRCEVLVSLLLCVVLVIPSIIGVYREHRLIRVEADKLQDYTSSIENAELETDPLFTKYAKVMTGLNQWDTLSVKEREKLLSGVVMMEKEHLGIETMNLEVVVNKLSENTVGTYTRTEQRIYLNISQINWDSMEKNITTVFHEVFHAFESYMVDALDFDSDLIKNSYYFAAARSWKENSNNYISSGVSFDGYVDQPLERDANLYAQKRLAEYDEYFKIYNAAKTPSTENTELV